MVSRPRCPWSCARPMSGRRGLAMRFCTMTTLTPTDGYIGDVREAWNRILPGLKKLCALPALDGTIQQVRVELESDEWLLLLDAREPTAFAVACLRAYHYNPKELELFVKLAWHPGGDAFERFDDYLQSLA